MRTLTTILILLLLLFSLEPASSNTKIGNNITGVQQVIATNVSGEGSGITNISRTNVVGQSGLDDAQNTTINTKTTLSNVNVSAFLNSILQVTGLQDILNQMNNTHSSHVDLYNIHVNATTGIHGVGSGEIVGTTLTQNLTNKTLTNPIVVGELTLPGNPANSLSSVPKQYVDALINGLTWKDTITISGLIADNLTTPPTSNTSSDAYIVSSGGTGVWLGLDNHLVEWNGTTWVDFGVIINNTRLGISFGTTTIAGGNFSGKDNQIVTITSINPNTYTYNSSVKGDAIFVDNATSINGFYGYVYGSDSSWHKFTRVSSTEAGLGLSFSGNTLNIGTDNSNHITLSADGIDVGNDILLSTGSYSNPSWLTLLAWSKISGEPCFNCSIPAVNITNPPWISTESWNSDYNQSRFSGMVKNDTVERIRTNISSDVNLSWDSTSGKMSYNRSDWNNKTVADNKATWDLAGTAIQNNNQSVLIGVGANLTVSGSRVDYEERMNVTYNDSSNSFGAVNQSFNGSALFFDSYNLGVGTKIPDTAIDVQNGGIIRVGGSTSPAYPTSGQGFEVAFDSDKALDANSGSNGTSVFQSYSRQNISWRDLLLRGSDVGIDTNGSLVIRIRGGYVGIGIRYPTNKLDVNGRVNATNFTGDGSLLNHTQIRYKNGTNEMSGIAVLSSGTVTVSNTKTTANSDIVVHNLLCTSNWGAVEVTSITVGVDFTITSTNLLSSCAVRWTITERYN